LATGNRLPESKYHIFEISKSFLKNVLWPNLLHHQVKNVV